MIFPPNKNGDFPANQYADPLDVELLKVQELRLNDAGWREFLGYMNGVHQVVSMQLSRTIGNILRIMLLTNKGESTTYFLEGDVYTDRNS